jgi:3-methyl-2-oxobutanoate hydroxymethyltransferase
MDTVTIPALQQMKRDGKKSVGVVAWDFPMARIADRAGVDFVSVGDSVGVNLWGHANPLEVTLDEILVVCKAVRRGTTHALVSCDLPFGPVQQGVDTALAAAIRIVKEGGADVVKVDAAADFPDSVRALVRAGIPVFAQFGLTPQTALKFGIPYGAQSAAGAQASSKLTKKLVAEAKLLEDAGASMLDFTNSGPVAGAAVARRPGAARAHRDRLRREVARRQDRNLRQHREGEPRGVHGADRRRAGGPPDQGLTDARPRPLAGSSSSSTKQRWNSGHLALARSGRWAISISSQP